MNDDLSHWELLKQIFKKALNMIRFQDYVIHSTKYAIAASLLSEEWPPFAEMLCFLVTCIAATLLDVDNLIFYLEELHEKK